MSWGLSSTNERIEQRANFLGSGTVPAESLEFGMSHVNAVPSDSIDRNTGRIINPADLGDFGRINSTSNNPRLIQLALKLNF